MVDIERSIVINAPLEKVWNAIADSTAFGTWFGAEFDGPFVAGSTASARMAPTRMDAEIAAQQAPYAGQPFTLEIVAIEPPRRLAFRWQPSPESEVRTIVEFTLTQETGGVRVRITEDGFDALPDTLRDASREGNDQGWAAQARLLATYLERS